MIFRSVVADMRLANGQIFSLPVTLDVNQDVATAIRNSSNVELRYEGKKVGSIEIEDIFTCDKTATALQVFGTSEDRHPGVTLLSDEQSFCGWQSKTKSARSKY